MKDGRLEDIATSGFRSLDSEHHVQLELLSAYRILVEDSESRARQTEILEQLIDYTKAHFASEQLLMRLYSYPHYQEHAADHEEALLHLEEIQAAHAARSGSGAIAAADALVDALCDHIRGDDRALGHFIIRLGVGPG